MQIRIIDKNFEDLCYKSIDFLEDRVASYLKKEFNILSPWFVDSVSGTVDHRVSEKEEVVLFGSFIQRFLETGCWDFEKARFWVLSEQVKTVLVELVGLPKNSVKIIPREELITPKPIRKINREKTVNLIYSGRLSDSKNLISIIYTAYYLQKNIELNFNLILYGDFDNVSSIYSTKEDVFNFENEVKAIINELDWERKPQFKGDMDSKEWVKDLPENSILINFSNYICEDFGVSIAQALENGTPCIVSEWGGLVDYKDTGFLKIPSHLITEGTGNYRLLKPRSKIIADFIINNWGKVERLNNKSKDFIHEYISKANVAKCRSSFVKQWGYGSLFLLRGQANKFYALESGERFFDRYSEIFSRKKRSMPNKIIFVDNRLNRDLDYLEKARMEIGNSLNSDEVVVCVKIEKAMWKTTINKILNATEVVFFHYPEELDKLINFVREISKKNAVIKVYAREDIISSSTTGIKMIKVGL